MRQSRLLLLVLLCACHRSRRIDDLQQLIPLTNLPTDPAVLDRIRQQHPCAPEERGIRIGGDSLPASVRCTLVAAAVAAIRDGQGADDIAADLRQFRPRDVRCALIHAEAYRNGATREIELARWTVEFPSDVQPSLAVDIDRRTGTARAYRERREFGYRAAQVCADARPPG